MSEIEDRVGLHGRDHRLRQDATVLLDRQVGHPEAVFFQPLARVERGLVLDLAGDDVLAALLVQKSAAPLSAEVIDSVAPEVKTISLPEPPIRSAIWIARVIDRSLGRPAERADCGWPRCRTDRSGTASSSRARVDRAAWSPGCPCRLVASRSSSLCHEMAHGDIELLVRPGEPGDNGPACAWDRGRAARNSRNRSAGATAHSSRRCPDTRDYPSDRFRASAIRN